MGTTGCIVHTTRNRSQHNKWQSRGSGDLDPTFDIILLALESINNPTLRPTAPSTFLSLPMEQCAPWNVYTETRATNSNPLLAVRACLLSFLSLPLQDSRLSGSKPSLSAKSLFFCSPCFLDEMVYPTWFFLLAPFLCTLSLDPAARCCFLCLPLRFPKEHRVISPRRDAHFRVLRYVGSKFSMSITFDIGYERLLNRYSSRKFTILISCLPSNTSPFFNFLSFDSSLSPPIASMGL